MEYGAPGSDYYGTYDDCIITELSKAILGKYGCNIPYLARYVALQLGFGYYKSLILTKPHFSFNLLVQNSAVDQLGYH